MNHEVECINCGDIFLVDSWRIKKNTKWCSMDCQREYYRKKNTKICETCGKTFASKQNKKFCSRKCAHKNLRKRIKRVCEMCGKEFETCPSGIKNGRGRFCSRACFYKSPGARKGKPKIKRIKKICETCGKEFKIAKYRLKKEPGRFCSRKCKDVWMATITGEDHWLYNQSALICEFCGSEYKTKPALANRSRFCSRSCQGSWTVRNTQSPTSIEITVREILNSMNIEFQEQEPIGPWLCDFFIPSENLIIEADGVYWHNLPDVIKRDKRKGAWLKKHGYNLVRLPGDKIRKKPEWCIEEIEKHLNSQPR